MRVPFEWLKEFIELEESPSDVAHKLTMIGLEVEAIEELDGDIVFELNVTPNRPDCLSILGIARELSAIYNIPVKFPEHSIAAEIKELDFNVNIIDSDLCHRYAGRIVKNIKIAQSPDWMIKRLQKCNIRAINNVVDITNYVLLELGHPLHAFDLDKIEGHLIRVGTPKELGYKDKVIFKTLDNVEREIPEDALLIWDSKKPIAIAGIMGGTDTEVSDSTRNIFIESAYFDPSSVRRTSKRLGLKTESSYRFERGTDIKILKKALDRAAYLMKLLAHGDIYGKIDIYPKRFFPADIVVRVKRVNDVLGLDLSKDEIFNVLNRLGLEVEDLVDRLRIKPPAYRRDLQNEYDIIEEVARLYGYDRIKAELPKGTIGISQESEVRSQESIVKNNIKQSLLKSGFTEVINYSFMGFQDLDLLRINEDDEKRNAIVIKNPLKVEDTLMRTTLLSGLIRNLRYNISQGNRDLRLFEIAKVYIRSQDYELPYEREHLAILLYKEKVKALYRDDTPVFYVVKGIIEAILNDLKIYEFSFVRSKEPFLHPGQSADIYIVKSQESEIRRQRIEGKRQIENQDLEAEIKIGYIGSLSPEILDELDLSTYKPSIVVAEIDLSSLLPHVTKEVRYRPIPKYPFIERDTAIIVDADLEAETLLRLLRYYQSELIEDIFIFDVYQGKNIPEDKKSIAFNVRYRSSKRTLTDDEVDNLHNNLVKYVLKETKGQLRQ
jgi:phenylalanyl-tRNA synthetase beta chain